MTKIYANIGLGLLAFLLFAVSVYGIYHHGLTVSDAKWQAKWDKRDADDATARAAAEQAARKTEEANQAAITKVQTDATQKLEQARTDAASANASADGLRKRVQQLLTASHARANTPAASGSAPGADAGDLLANVLEQSVERNRDLAKVADSALTRGKACEAAYDSLRANQH